MTHHLCQDHKCPLSTACTRHRSEPNLARSIFYDRSPRQGEECHAFAPKGCEAVGDLEAID